MLRALSRWTCVLSSLLLAGSVDISTTAAQTAMPALDVLADQVAALFPKIDGEVVEAQDSAVTVGIGSRDGLLPGVVLSVYRQGRELHHPKTGEVLGRTEQTIGRAAIDHVFETYSTGTMLQGADVKPGDRVRVSAGKIKLILVPIVDAGFREPLADAATRELVGSLSRTTRFQISPGDSISVWLAQQGITREDALAGKGLESVAERFKVEHMLLIAFTRVQNKPYMEVRLFSAPGATSRLSTALFVPPTIKATPKGDYSAGRPRDNQTPAPQRSFLARLLYGDLDAGAYSSGESSIPLKEVAKFPFVVVSMDLALGSKDKIPRMVITDGERIFLYRISPERILEPVWTYKSDARGRIFSVQLAELTDEGVLHVVANRYNPNRTTLLTSFILTSQDKKPVVTIETVPDILLAVDASGDGVKKTLWAQTFTQTGFFKQGDATRMGLRNDRLESLGRVPVPSSFRATGATFANIAGKGPRALAFIDEYSRLRVAIDSQDVFRSSAQVGSGPAKLTVLSDVEKGGRIYLYNPEPMPLAVDLDGDGIEEIVVPQNQIPGRLAVVYKGPAGYRFQTVNSGFEGTVMALGAITGDGPIPTLVAAVVRYTNFRNTEGETQIIMTTSE